MADIQDMSRSELALALERERDIKRRVMARAREKTEELVEGGVALAVASALGVARAQAEYKHEQEGGERPPFDLLGMRGETTIGLGLLALGLSGYAGRAENVVMSAGVMALGLSANLAAYEAALEHLRGSNQ